jgi:hypothetical protein
VTGDFHSDYGSDNGPDNGPPSDLAAIADITRTFFAAFVSGPDSADRLEQLRQVLLPEAVIVRTCGDGPTVYGVDSFIAPRQALLAGGTLTGFSEWELAGRTDVFGDIAHRFCSYAKAGVQDGQPRRGTTSATGWRSVRPRSSPDAFNRSDRPVAARMPGWSRLDGRAGGG